VLHRLRDQKVEMAGDRRPVARLIQGDGKG
jgi:hypothetical protein